MFAFLWFVLTVNETQTQHSHRQEFKSPAEERLIRKMAKMALNGYEIGIQRKIKPADHIQSMAEKIQDTVVTKHPLNSDNTTSSDSSRENTLNKSMNKTDKSYKICDSINNIGDKIKDTIRNNHPATANFTNGNIPVPPPIPTTPVPSLDTYSTQFNQTSKKYNENNTNASRKFSNLVFDHLEATYNSEPMVYLNGCDNEKINDDSNKNKTENFSILDKTIDSFNVINNSQNTSTPNNKIDVNHSNTLSKRNIFEKRIEESYNNNTNKSSDKLYRNGINTTNTTKEKSMDSVLESKVNNILQSSKQNDDKSYKNNLPNNYSDNTLYHFTQEKNNKEMMEKQDISKNASNENNLSNAGKDNAENDFIVKRRQKKTDTTNDGRRDSHIIARPLSTMKSEDVADGLYPVCHKCDKAITR